MNQTICRHLSITGRVQGVGFRWSLCVEAEALGLHGWVRNRRDGSVEALIHGPLDCVEALTRWAQHGPGAARVDAVIDTAQEANGLDLPGGFEQRATL